MNTRSTLKQSVVEALSLCLLGAAIGMLYNAVSGRGIDVVRKERQLQWSSDTTQQTAPQNSPRPLLIDIDQAYKIYQAGNALFIDARHDDEYKEGHIKGAVSLPLKKLEADPGLLKGMPKDTLIVTYCSGVECELSIDLGEKLASMGFTNVKIFFSGWLDWQQRNLPIEVGAKENL